MLLFLSYRLYISLYHTIPLSSPSPLQDIPVNEGHQLNEIRGGRTFETISERLAQGSQLCHDNAISPQRLTAGDFMCRFATFVLRSCQRVQIRRRRFFSFDCAQSMCFLFYLSSICQLLCQFMCCMWAPCNLCQFLWTMASSSWPIVCWSCIESLWRPRQLLRGYGSSS